MPAPWTPPPPIPLDDLTFSAKIDYLTIAPFGARRRLPTLAGTTERVPPTRNTGYTWWLTVHDPTPGDLRELALLARTSRVMAVELAVDLQPKANLDPTRARAVLEQTFHAVAARFRPEDKALWDYGQRGAMKKKGQKVQPLERRLARLGEEVVYGHRVDLQQAKVYLKTLDQGAELAEADHRVRMELSVRGYGCSRFGIELVQDLIGYRYRKQFTTHFRIIDRPEVRRLRGLSPAELAKRAKKMARAWSTAGVGKFAVGDKPREDKLPHALKLVQKRERAQLPADQYKLVRDQKTNAKIGAALMNLQRRLAG